MKKIFIKTALSALISLFSLSVIAQQNVGIGTSTPNANSILELNSTSQGFLLPRMSTAQRLAIAGLGAADKGLLVYDNSLNTIYQWDGASWAAIGGADNLGNHTATTILQMAGFRINSTSSHIFSISGLDVMSISSGSNSINALQGQFRALTGTAVTSPAYAFSTNTTTGMSNPSANELTLVTNGAERMRFSSTGNVGINNSSPSERLDVTGNIRFSGALMPNNAAGTAGQMLQSNGPGVAPTWVNPAAGISGSGTATQVAYWNSATALTSSANFYWDNTNIRLGVGTSAPQAGIHINDVNNYHELLRLQSPATNNGFIRIIDGTNYNHVIGAANSTGTGVLGSGIPYAFEIGTQNAQPITFHTNNVLAPRMTIATGGNVGIGNSAPTQALDVTGNVKFSGALMPNNTAGTAGQLLQSNGPGVAPTWVNPAAGLTGSGTATQVAFWNSATALTSSSNLYWDNTNTRLGVGTSSPTYNTHVIGTLAATSTPVAPINHDATQATFAACNPNNFGQSFVATTTGFIKSIELKINGGISAGTVTIDMYNSATNTGAGAYTEVITIPVDPGAGWRVFNLAVPFPVTNGNTYAFRLAASGCITSIFVNTTDTYASGGRFSNGSFVAGWDMGFRVNYDVPGFYANVGGNVGIGTSSPTAKLEVQGSVKIADGTQGVGKILTSDANGNATWQTPGGGTGTVTSVGLTAPGIFSVSGSPVTTSGSLGLSLTSQAANTFFAAPNGAAGTPTFRGIMNADLPIVNLNNGGTNANLSAVNGGVVYSTATAMAITPAGTSGQVLTSNGAGAPTWTTPAAGLSGSGTATQVAFWNSATSLTSSSNLYWDNTNGRLGIGTAAPGFRLQVDDATTVGGATALRVNQTGAQAGYGYAGYFVKSGAGTSNVGLWVEASGGTNNYAAIFNQGNVGIGTTTPTERLDISGNVRFSGALMPNNLAGTAGQVLTSAGPGVAPTWTNPTTGWGLTGNAGTVVGTNFIGTTDDVALRFKVNNQNAGFISGSAGTLTTFGYMAGNVNTGANNTYFGYRAGITNTTGSNNAAFGSDALGANIQGNNNTAVGLNALRNNSYSGRNTAVGKDALAGQSFTNANIAYNSDNVAIGFQALMNNQPTSSINGNQNTAIGNFAGDFNATGASNTFVGYNADATVNNLTNATAIGANAVVGTSNTVQLGSNADVRFDRALLPGGAAGTAGQVLTSAGAGAVPTWTTPSGSLPAGTSAQTLRHDGANWIANSFLQNTGTTVGIGVTTPLTSLHVGASSVNDAIAFQYAGATVGATGFSNVRSRGTLAAPAAVQSGDRLGHYGFNGYNGTDYGIPVAEMYARATQNYTGAAQGTSLHFGTTPNGTLAPVERMMIDQNGNVGVGTSTPNNLLELFSTNSGVNNTGQFRISNANNSYTYINAYDPGVGNYFFDINPMVNASTDNVQVRLFRKTVSTGTLYFTLHDGSGAATQANVALSGNSDSYINVNTGNVGIGNNTPSEKLDVTGNVKFSGALMPNALAGTAGQVLTSAGPGVAPTWTTLATGTNWSLTGNSGTNSGTNYLGTSDNVSVRFRTANTQRMVIDSLGSVGIGIAAPASVLHVASEASAGDIFADRAINSTFSNGLTTRKSRGTLAAPAIVLNGDEFGDILFSGYNGTGYNTGARIIAHVDGVPGVGDMPGRLVFYTTADGAASETERMRINSAGNVGIGTTAPLLKLDVRGATAKAITAAYANVFQVASTDAASPLAMRVGIKTDATATNRYAAIEVDDAGVKRNLILQPAATGNVGVGTIAPTTRFHIENASSPAFRLVDGTQAAGRVLTSDGTGNASWQDIIGMPTGIAGQTLRHNGTNWAANSLIYNDGTNIGIGTTSLFPARLVDVITVDGIALHVQNNSGTYAAGYFRNLNVAGLALRVEDGNAVVTNGNLGVGTTAPAVRLHVAGTSPVFRIADGTQGVGKVMVSNANGDGTWETLASQGITSGSGTLNYVTKWTGTTTQGNSMMYDNGTQIGIGTSSPTAGTMVHIFSSVAGVNPTFAVENGIGNGSMRFSGGASHYTVGADATDNSFKIANSAFGLNSSTRLTISSVGNVGIGTTTPGHPLQINEVTQNPYIQFTDNITGTAASDGLIVGTNGAGTMYILGQETTTHLNIGTPGVNNLMRFWGNTNRISVDNGATPTAPSALFGINYVGAETATNYGSIISNQATNSTTDGIIKYGMFINNFGAFTGGAGAVTRNYGLYVGNIAGADENYAAVFQTGNVGIGTIAPINKLDVDGAVAIGASYGGTNAAPANGLIVEGNVGIGTATPGHKIHMQVTSGYLGIESTTAGSTPYGIRLFSPDHNWYLLMSPGGAQPGAFSIYDGTTSRYMFYIDPVTDYIGIFDNTPSYPLDVSSTTASYAGRFKNLGTAGADGLRVEVTTAAVSTGTRVGFYSSVSGGLGVQYAVEGVITSGGTTNYGLYGYAAGGSTNNWAGYFSAGDMYLNATGQFGMGTTTPAFQLHLSTNSAAKPTSNVWTVSSDARLKTNVRKYEAGIKDLMKIEPVWFTYTGEAGMPKETGIGVIAQDLQKVAPYMVSEWTYKATKKVINDKGQEEEVPTGESQNYLGVDNGAMTYMLINAAKEQQKEIEDLKAENAKLKADLELIKTKLGIK